MKRRAISITLLIALVLAVSEVSTAADTCLRAKVLFNKSLACKDVKQELALLKRAGRLCQDPAVLAPVFNNMGDAYERMGRFSLAFRYYKKAVEVNSGLAMGYFSAASLYLKMGDAYSAWLVYQKGLWHAPSNQKALSMLKEAENRYQNYMIIYFPFDSARLTPSAKRRLEVFLKGLKKNLAQDPGNGHYRITVVGHTCDLGPRRYNQWLGLKRAKAAAGYLKERLPHGRTAFRVRSLGEESPLINAKDPIARKLNRRVEMRWGIQNDTQGPLKDEE